MTPSAEGGDMRVLVCGGREFGESVDERDLLRATLAGLKIATLIHGGARGADALAEKFALDRGIPTIAFLAEWGKLGKAAGFIRNQRMLTEGRPDLVVAFPGGRGTADMVRRAKAAGVRVMEIRGCPRCRGRKTVVENNLRGFRLPCPECARGVDDIPF